MPTVSELLAALPEADRDTPAGPLPAEIRELYARLARQPIPTGSVHRVRKLGELNARILMAYVAYWLKRWYQDDARRQQSLVDTRLRAAMHLLETMGYLRGAAMKVIQVVASFPSIVPAEFVSMLERLQFQAPGMHYSLVREHLMDELGGDPEQIFEAFETEPFAVASLGQVHRARLRSGEAVALKIQYPGIARTIRSDFRSLHAILAPLRLSRDWDNLELQINGIRHVLDTETDYEQEARYLRRARALFDEDDGIIVPRVYDRFTTHQVLAMERIEGPVTHDFLNRGPSDAVRTAFAGKIYRAFTRLFCRERMYHTDLHPGNFIFCDDGRLGLIDLGGVRVLNDEEWAFCESAKAVLTGADDDLVSVVQRSLMLTDDEVRAKAELVDVSRRFADWTWRPQTTDGPFDFTDPDYLREGFRLFSGIVAHRHTRTMPISIFMHRAFFEMAALMYQLHVRLDCRSIWMEEQQAAGLN